MEPENETAGKTVILFDGVCNLCNASVNFVIERDPKQRFVFASLQSEAAQPLLRRHHLGQNALDSIVLVEPDRAHTHSTAALHIARGLKGPWPLLYAFILVPRPMRDAAYRWVARNRYRWFGKSETCRLPTPALRRRFL